MLREVIAPYPGLFSSRYEKRYARALLKLSDVFDTVGAQDVDRKAAEAGEV
jgi:hypothetical protein